MLKSSQISERINIVQKGHFLQFSCQSCHHPVCFSLFELEQGGWQVRCSQCDVSYDFNEVDLRRQLRKFEALCRQIHESEEILSNTSVGVHIGDREIKIPFKILLSRLNSTLDLMMGDAPIRITFRIEPAHDLKGEANT